MRALDIEGLRHHNEFIDKMNEKDFFNTIRIHIDSKLPLILGGEVYGVRNEEGKKVLTKKAGHAVTILGYKASETKQAIYIHDDRLGPFVRASFVDITSFEFDSNDDTVNRHIWGLMLQEKDDNGIWEAAHEVLFPDSLIVPTHKKVRLSSSFAVNTCSLIVSEWQNWVRSLDDNNEAEENSNQIRFEIKLSEISTIRQNIINHEYNHKESDGQLLTENQLNELKKDKVAFLTGRYARFQWVASFFYNENPAFRILFDATDIPQGKVISSIFIENTLESEAILAVFRNDASSVGWTDIPTKKNFFSAFLKYFKQPESSLSSFLDEKYGELRAPKYLKGEEVVGGQVNHNDSLLCFYESTDSSLNTLFNDASALIWAIAHDGALLIGKEIGAQGHPSLTGFKPARIAGELRKSSDKWVINSKSGRYSGDYHNANVLLENALKKFKSIFYTSRNEISAELR